MIIEFLSEFDLQLLLPRGTITYLGNLRERTFTINFIMTTGQLFSSKIICQIHQIVHGSDHLIISTEFFLTDSPKLAVLQRRLYKNAD